MHHEPLELFLPPCNLNVVAIAITDVCFKMASVTQFHNAGTKKRKRLEARLVKALWVFGLGSPVVLMGIAYAYDDLDPSSSMFFSHFGRWTFLCGPRLEPALELGVVYIPLFISGSFVMVQSFRTLRYTMYAVKATVNMGMSSSKTGSGQQKQKNKAKGGVKKKKKTPTEALIDVASTIAKLGLFTTLFLLLFAGSTIVLVPKLSAVAETFMDWMNCQLTPGGVYATLTVQSCAAFEGVEITAFEGRPDVALLSLSFAVQPLVCVLFGTFFLLLRKDSRVWERS